MASLFIIQSNYIPWKGYFDAINKADIVVIYDEMQFTKNDWRNRNIIKTPHGPQWLTIPVKQSGKFGQKINETEASQSNWRKKHWKSLYQSYNKATYFDEVSEFLKSLYLEEELSQNLSEINMSFIQMIMKYLEIDTQIIRSKNIALKGDKNERILNICRDLKVNKYYSGAAAKEYLDVSGLNSNNVDVEFLNYTGYPEYNQLHGDFDHAVSILDLLFNMGKTSSKYMKSFTSNG